MIHIDEAALRRYQDLAERDPPRYRAHVTLMAIAGDVMLTVAQVAPIALPIAFGVLLYPHPWLIWIAVGAVGFFVWLVRPQLHVIGRRLDRSEAPSLFRAVDEMQVRLQVHGRIEIRLDEQFNASAGEGRGLFGLLGTRRVLTLGMPFLACLSKDDVLSVVAHELGHFSRRHGMLGNWLYRARTGWASYAELTDWSTSPLERATGWYAQRFAPRFLTLSLVHSRACEYEADRDAASLVGADRFAAALTRVNLISEYGWAAFQREMNRWKQDMPMPPTDFHARLRAEVERQLQGHRDDWIERALNVASGWHDTHPSLADRLKALGERADLLAVERTAGDELLEGDWMRLVGEFDAKRHTEQAPAWRIEHEAHKRFWAPLLQGHAQTRGRDRSERLLRARALRQIDPPSGLAEMQQLHREQPDDASAAFALASALLREDRQEGIEIMDAVAEREAPLSEGAYSRLLSYAKRVGDGEGEKRWGRRWQLAAAALHSSAEKAMADVRAGLADSSTIGARVVRFVEDAMRGDPAILHAWLVCVEEAVTNGRQSSGKALFHVLVVRLDMDVLKRTGDSEDRLRERYQAAIASVIPLDEFVLGLSLLNTEPLPAFLSAYPELVRSTVAEAATV